MNGDETFECSLDSDILFDQIVPKAAASQETETTSYIDSDSDVIIVDEQTDITAATNNKNNLRPRRRSVGSLEDKVKKKNNTALESETKKQRLKEEKAAKQRANEINKIYKPGECMKYMCVEMHPMLAEAWYCADVKSELALAGARLVLNSNICEPALVMWSRTQERRITAGHSGQVCLSAGCERVGRGLLVLSAEEVAELVQGHGLAKRAEAASRLAGCPLTLLLFGLPDYFKSSNRKTRNSKKFAMTEIELEMAITDLLVGTECDTSAVSTASELALLIVRHTRAVAEAPYKQAQRECDEQVDFYMRGDNKKCVTVDKNGNGLKSLWQQMIAVLPSSSLETARTVCAKYKSPLQLFEAVQTSRGVQELADVGVTRTGVPSAKARKIGPEFARKLQKLFTETDGDSIID